jgi:hypothetical protein
MRHEVCAGETRIAYKILFREHEAKKEPGGYRRIIMKNVVNK